MRSAGHVSSRPFLSAQVVRIVPPQVVGGQAHTALVTPSHAASSADTDPLDGIEDPDWHTLSCNGTSTRLPALLRTAVHGTGDEADRACDELFDSLWHQHTVYPASGVLLPFLIAVAADPRCGFRAELLALAGSIGLEVRRILGPDPLPRLRGVLAEDAPVDPDELAWLRAARESLEDAWPRLVVLATDADVAIRRAALHVPASLDRHRPRVTSVLRAAIDDPDALVRVGAICALARLCGQHGAARPARTARGCAESPPNPSDARRRAASPRWSRGPGTPATPPRSRSWPRPSAMSARNSCAISPD